MADGLKQRHRGEAIDYTPGSDKVAGDCVFHNGLCGMVINPIASGTLGALQVRGVVSAPKAAGGGVTFAIGQPVYWNSAGPLAVATPGSFPQMGVCTKAAADGDTTVDVALNVNTLQTRAGVVTLDGGNPTPVVTGLNAIVGAAVSLKAAATPGDDPTSFSVDFGGAVAAGTLNVYAYKTDGADPTLVASTNNAAVVSWVAWGY